MGKTILVVEDETDIRETLKFVLEDAGFQVYSAGNGNEALNILEEFPLPQLILLDILMPVMNGREFRERQKNMQRLADIPILIMSADNHPDRKMGETGLSYVKKPIDLHELLEKVDKVAAEG